MVCAGGWEDERAGLIGTVHSRINFKDDLVQPSPLLNIQVNVLRLSLKKQVNQDHKTTSDRTGYLTQASYSLISLFLSQLEQSRSPME